MKKIAYVLLGVALAVGILAVVIASPGSDQDPLVTQSYVEKRLEEVKSELKSSSVGSSVGQITVDAPVFDVYNFTKGTRLAFGQSTEFIVRRGKATVVDPLGNMIPDLTTGVDIGVDKEVPLNHLMLVPQEDGRGIMVVEDIWIMIKGPFVEFEK